MRFWLAICVLLTVPGVLAEDGSEPPTDPNDESGGGAGNETSSAEEAAGIIGVESCEVPSDPLLIGQAVVDCATYLRGMVCLGTVGKQYEIPARPGQQDTYYVGVGYSSMGGGDWLGVYVGFSVNTQYEAECRDQFDGP